MTCFRLKNGQALIDYCRENGLRYQTFYTRCDTKGIFPDEALATPVRHYNTCCLDDGTPLKEACKKTGVVYTSVLGRFYKEKETIQQAFDRLYERKTKRAKLFRRNGK